MHRQPVIHLIRLMGAAMLATFVLFATPAWTQEKISADEARKIAKEAYICQECAGILD